MMVITNENNELIPTRLFTGWRICVDYQKLNDATRKDHFPLLFMDQMLERLARNEFHCFLNGFSGYFQIPIDPQDQEKTTFTCPYGTFAYQRMPFGICNAPGTFQRCMVAIFHDMIEKTMEVFMDDFFEKCHFMVKEGIVLGHKISKSGIEVDQAKVDVILKLPPPTTCQSSFELLKKKLIEAHILVSPDWDLPFEIICDASDFAVGAVLGQRKDKYFRPIHYVSKTLSDAQTNYTVTEKELLVVVYASEKFWSYINLISKFAIIKGAENLTAHHLTRLENPHQEDLVELEMNDNFPHETLNMIALNPDNEPSWFADIANYLVGNVLVKEILFGGVWTGRKLWIFFKLATMVPPGDIMARTTPPRKFSTPVSSDPPYTAMPTTWSHTAIDLMGLFPSSRGNRYILVDVDYMSKWVEAKALPTNDARVVVKFLKQLFSRFGTPWTIISDRGTTPYTPQQKGVAERKNKVLQDMINAMLINANLLKNLRGEALLTTCHSFLVHLEEDERAKKERNLDHDFIDSQVIIILVEVWFMRFCDFMCSICVCVGYVILDNQSIERDRLNGIGFVLNFVKFISFTFGDKEMILVIEAVSQPFEDEPIDVKPHEREPDPEEDSSEEDPSEDEEEEPLPAHVIPTAPPNQSGPRHTANIGPTQMGH
ncbi:reverse transcriptase domain-containing protein [Tanacetum coccineum]